MIENGSIDNIMIILAFVFSYLAIVLLMRLIVFPFTKCRLGLSFDKFDQSSFEDLGSWVWPLLPMWILMVFFSFRLFFF